MNLACVFGHDWHNHGSYFETLALPNGEPNHWLRKYHQVLVCSKCQEVSSAWQTENRQDGVWVRCDLRRIDEEGENDNSQRL